MIQLAQINDLKEIITLNKIVDYHQPDEFMKESILAWKIFIYKDQEKIKGFLLYQDLWGNTILLSLLKVHSDFYKQWIGTSLLKYFENFLQEKGIKSYMSSTMSDNIWAQIFHEKKEFKNVWTLEMHYGNEIFYRKDFI